MAEMNIKQKAAQLGFASCGIIPAAVFDEYNRYLDERIRTFPQSKTRYDTMFEYASPPESAKSIIVCLQRLNKYKVPDSLKGLIGKMYLFDERLAFSDEHRARQEFETYLKLHGINILDCPVPDRWAAAKAGLGKFGRNNFIYSPEHGSHVCVSAWVVDKELDCDPVPQDIYLSECCDTCQKCIRACPTVAFSGAYSMDMKRCLAYLTFDAEDTLDEATRSQMGRWVYGCDVCQDVCPVNKGKFTENNDFPLLSQFEEYLKLENLLAMDETTFATIVHPRFWYGGNAQETLWRWKSNTLRSMINSRKTEYHHLVKGCLDHEDERLRELARWGCAKLQLS